MFEIEKEFTFSAGHRLTGLAEGHKCARIHGHSYRVRLRITSPRLDSTGMVIDYADLDPFGAWLTATFDHRWLGSGTLTDEAGEKTEPCFESNPTAEKLAYWFRAWAETELPAVTQPLAARPVPMDVAVGVSETGKTWAWSR